MAGSIVLAAILLKLGTFGLLRLSRKFLILNLRVFCEISSICLVGAIIRRLICIRQRDLKSLVAYSSVAHIGLATRGILSCTIWGCAGAFVIMLAHGLCSSGIFNFVNVVYEGSGRRSFYVRRGLLSIFPKLRFWCFLLASINMAAPPSPNLLGEIELIRRIIVRRFYSICLLGRITFMAGAYCLIFYTMTQHGGAPNFIGNLRVIIGRNYSSILLHILPLIFLIIKRDIISV